jgi:hypothetical protein
MGDWDVKVAGKVVCFKVRVPRQASRQVRISEREDRAHHEGWRRLWRAWPPSRLPAPSLYKGQNCINIKCLWFLIWSCLAITLAFLCRGSDSTKEYSCAGKRRPNKTQQAKAKQGGYKERLQECEREDKDRWGI